MLSGSELSPGKNLFLDTNMAYPLETMSRSQDVNQVNGDNLLAALQQIQVFDKLQKQPTTLVPDVNTLQPLLNTLARINSNTLPHPLGFDKLTIAKPTITSKPPAINPIIPNESAIREAVKQAIVQLCPPNTWPVQVSGQIDLTIGLNKLSVSLSDDLGVKTSTTGSAGQFISTNSNLYISTSGLDVKSSQSASISSSRRKPSNPSRITPTKLKISPPGSMQTSPCLPLTTNVNGGLVVNKVHHSHPSSPYADSGALDLSRSGSSPSSTPITPIKPVNLSSVNGEAINLSSSPSSSSTITKPFNTPDWFLHYQQGFAAMLEQSIRGVKPTSSALKVKSATRRVRNVGLLSNRPGVRRSTTNRLFSCNQCRERFASLHVLEQHTMQVHGSYRCHMCNNRFTQRSNLQRHALKHVGFKPFECGLCPKSYFRKDHLMRHMEVTHPDVVPRDHIKVHLTSSESLAYLDQASQNTLSDLSISSLAAIDSSARSSELEECPTMIQQHYSPMLTDQQDQIVKNEPPVDFVDRSN